MPLLRLALPRLPTRHVYRAFRELDTYSDEQCRHFVHAAKGSIRRRLIGLAFIVLVTLIGTSAGVVGFWLFQRTYLTPHRTLDIGHPLVTWYGWLLNIALGIAVFAIGPILGYLTRDLFLIRRVRHILRTRGVCISCRYTLVGLFVAPDLSVTCPECGTTTTVDPALGELVTDEAGRPRFKPDESRHMARRFWTPARRRVLKRGSIALAIVTLLLAGAYETFLRWQASVARRERPTLDALLDLVEEYQPEGTRRSDPNAFDFLFRLSEIKASADDAVWRGPDSPFSGMYPDFQMIYAPERVGNLDEWPENRQKEIRDSQRVALALLDKHRELGLNSVLASIAATKRCMPNYNYAPSEPLRMMLLPHLGDVRQLAMACLARMRLATENRDLPEFTAAMEGSLALARILRHEPILIAHLVSFHMEMETNAQVRIALAAEPDAAWLDAISTLLARQRSHVPEGIWIRGEELVSHDFICHFFVEPGRARFGRWSPWLRSYVASLYLDPNSPQPTRLGTYRKNHHVSTERGNQLRAAATTPLPARMAESPTFTSLIPVWHFDGLDPVDMLDNGALLAADRDGLDLMIALERFRIARGEYPETLNALVPNFLPSLPLDPWSDAPYVYRRPGTPDQCAPAGYILYSIGSDGIDNGGTPSPGKTTNEHNMVMRAAKRADCVGFDWIVNAPLRNR